MNQNTKKQFSKIQSLVILLLAAVFVVMPLFPVVTVDINRASLGRVYTDGSFTENIIAPGKISIGLFTVIDVIRDFDDLGVIISIQSSEESIRSMEEEITEYQKKLSDKKSYSESSYKVFQEQIDKLKQNIFEETASILKVTEECGEERMDRIHDRLENDKKFVQSLVAFYSFIAVFDYDEAVGTSSKGSGLFIASTIIGGILFIATLLVNLVFLIVLFIKFLILLVKVLKNIKNGNIEKLDAATKKFPFMGYTLSIVCLGALMDIYAKSGYAAGKGLVFSVVSFAFVTIVFAVKEFLFTNENKTIAIIKQAVSIISIIALAVLLVNFIAVNPVDQLENVIADMSDIHLDTLNANKEKDAQDILLKSTTINICCVIFFSLITTIMVAGTASSLTERMSGKLMKTKKGDYVPYKPMVVASVFILVLAIIPSVFSVNSKEAQEKAFSKGTFKAWYQEYLTEDTTMNIKYEFLKDGYDFCEEEIESLNKDLKEAEGEETEQIKKEIVAANELLESIDMQIKEIENANASRILCIVMALVFVGVEYAYFFIANKLTLAKSEQKEEIAD